MYYEIEKCQRLKGGGPNDYYLLAYCWLDEVHMEIGLPPWLTEDFHIRRASLGRRVITNAQGWLLSVSGVFIDPATLDVGQPKPRWQYEDVLVDLKKEFQEVVETTLLRLLDNGWRGDRTADVTKLLWRLGNLVRQRGRPQPLEGNGIELLAIKPLAKSVLL